MIRQENISSPTEEILILLTSVPINAVAFSNIAMRLSVWISLPALPRPPFFCVSPVPFVVPLGGVFPAPNLRG